MPSHGEAICRALGCRPERSDVAKAIGALSGEASQAGAPAVIIRLANRGGDCQPTVAAIPRLSSPEDGAHGPIAHATDATVAEVTEVNGADEH